MSDTASDRPVAHLLVTDLDNTLWDWFEIWYRSFGRLLVGVSRASGVPVADLEREIRVVHQRRGTSEYSYLLAELPSLLELHRADKISSVYAEQIHQFRSVRKAHTKLYPGVIETLTAVKRKGIAIVAYTESLSFYSSSRIRMLGLDGVIDVLYSSPDHDFPYGVSSADLRSRPDEDYEFGVTEHRHVPYGVLKPDPRILKQIISSFDVDPAHTVYVGDSLMKDVAMAQTARAQDVLAKYGAVTNMDSYAQLQRVSHWTEEDVRREQRINSAPHVTPTFTLHERFDELLDLFDFRAVDD